jgi:hypothetical protein
MDNANLDLENYVLDAVRSVVWLASQRLLLSCRFTNYIGPICHTHRQHLQERRPKRHQVYSPGARLECR